MPAMFLGEELVIEAPVSRRLLRSARSAMDIYAAWWAFRPVPVQAPPGEVSGRPHGVGLFFTTGVDSFYSLLKDTEGSNEPLYEPITHLLFAKVEQQPGEDNEPLLTRLRHVARETAKELLVVDTNVRSLTAPVVHWPKYHGAALASVALALQGLLTRCLIASSQPYWDLQPWGSHPLLDHLWSTEGLEIVHDGAEASRVDKVMRQVRRSEVALENLSVCWESKPAHNCGVCEKCIRTMIALELSESLHRCATFSTTLDLDLIGNVENPEAILRHDMRKMAPDARRLGRHDIADAIEHGLQRYS